MNKASLIELTDKEREVASEALEDYILVVTMSTTEKKLLKSVIKKLKEK